MNWIEKMIAEQCPNGVEMVKLGKVCSFNRGRTITSKDAVGGDVPVIAGGLIPSYFHNEYNRCGETITVAGSGANAGFVAYWDIPVFLSDAFSVDTSDNLLTKYAYYYLKNNQNKIYSTQKGAGVPHVHGKDIANFEIPLPPLSIQKEIVSVLDKFSELIEKTDEEIALRQKQYEYYREKLLTFEDGEVEWKTLASVFDTRNGYTPSTKNIDFWNNGDIPWFKMEDIRDNGRILSDSKLHITSKAVKGKGLFKANTIILATSATIGEHALVTVDYLSNQRFTNLSVKKELAEKVDIKFYYFYMYIIDNWCKEHINQGGFASVDMGALYKLLIPIPSPSRQQSIVATLDKFETLISKLKEERELRQKQYEYYREKLLTF